MRIVVVIGVGFDDYYWFFDDLFWGVLEFYLDGFGVVGGVVSVIIVNFIEFGFIGM